jgi:hypothetical protein
MRETEIQYETSVEEQEVDLFYCDKCGDECTEEHYTQVVEVCPSCSDISRVDRWKNRDRDKSDLGPPTPGIMAVLALVSPLFITIALINPDDITENNRREIISFFTGGLIFGALIALLILVL